MHRHSEARLGVLWLLVALSILVPAHPGEAANDTFLKLPSDLGKNPGQVKTAVDRNNPDAIVASFTFTDPSGNPACGGMAVDNTRVPTAAFINHTPKNEVGLFAACALGNHGDRHFGCLSLNRSTGATRLTVTTWPASASAPNSPVTVASRDAPQFLTDLTLVSGQSGSPLSLNFEKIIMEYTVVDASGNPVTSKVFTQRSSNRGATWDAPVLAGAIAGVAIAPRLALDRSVPDKGWAAFVNLDTGDIVAASSQDAFFSFEPAQRAGLIALSPNPPGTVPGMPNVFPSPLSIAAAGAKLFVGATNCPTPVKCVATIFSDLQLLGVFGEAQAGPGTAGVVTRSLDPSLAQSFSPVVTATEDGVVTVTFASNREGQGNLLNIYRAESTDSGASFGVPTRVNAVPIDPALLALNQFSLDAVSRPGDPTGSTYTAWTPSIPASVPTAVERRTAASPPTTGVLALSVPNPPLPAPLVFATLPTTRVAGPGKLATFFLSIINAGADTATGVTIALNSSLPLDFFTQETDPATNTPIGPQNPSVDIPPGGIKSFVLALTPTATFPPSDVAFIVTGTNTSPAPTTIGVNTELLSSFTAPTPDIVALEATSPNDGIFRIRAGDNAAFAVAAVNVGAPGLITVGTNTGTVNLPLSIILCRTNPVLGNCISPVGPTVQTQINTNETPTFSIFVSAAAFIPFFPEQNRIFITFTDQNQTSVGGTSVAVETVP